MNISKGHFSRSKRSNFALGRHLLQNCSVTFLTFLTLKVLFQGSKGQILVFFTHCDIFLPFIEKNFSNLLSIFA